MEQSLEQGKKSVTDLFIRHFGFWPQLSDRERELLNTHTHAVRYKRGTQVHRGPFDCIGVMLIKRGQLRVYTLSEDGRDVTIYRLFADDIGILSAACTLDAVTFDVYIDAEEDTEVLLTDASAFRKLSEGNIYVRCFAYELASKRLSDMLWKLQQVLFLSADRRFAIFLLEESEKRKSDVIRLTHQQMARYMGTAREVVTRLIKYFNQEGWTTSGRGYLHIEDGEALRRLAGTY